MKSQIELKENYLPQSCRLWSVVCCCRHFLIPTLYPHLYLNLLAFHKHALNLDRAHAVIFICNAVWHLRSQKGKLLRRLIYSLLRERVHSHTRCMCCLGVTPFFFGNTGELFIRWELISAPDLVLEGVFAAGQLMSTHILHSHGGHFLIWRQAQGGEAQMPYSRVHR